jgi:hypothetical protein
MPSYRYQITEDDRWAIVAYVRALQRTTQGTVEDVPADQRAGMPVPPPPPPPQQPAAGTTVQQGQQAPQQGQQAPQPVGVK